MMSHSQQLQRLAKSHNRTKSESSLSSSSYSNSSISSSHHILPQVTSTTTTSHSSSFKSKSTKKNNIRFSSFSHQDHLIDHENITFFPCCFNLPSRRWSGLKLRCSGLSSFMASHGDVLVHVPSEIVSFTLSLSLVLLRICYQNGRNFTLEIHLCDTIEEG